VLAELLTWGLIAGVYALAFGVLALPKHWYRAAQWLFIAATILADAKIVHWTFTSIRGVRLRFALASLGVLATSATLIWFIRKVQADIKAGDEPGKIKPFYDQLTLEEKKILRHILPLHRSPTNLNVGQLAALESVQQKTGLVGRNYTTGSYELNPNTVESLKALLSSDATLAGTDYPPIDALPVARSSQLEISFDEQRAGFIDHTTVSVRGQRTPCTLYRISVTYHGRKSVLADLKAEEVTTLTDGRVWPPLYLRITGRPDDEKQRRLNPGNPGFWDVVEKVDSDSDWVTLRHTEQEGTIYQGTTASFKITASCDEDLPITKIVRMGIRDDGNLDFRLFEV
jgi:hypothetical protein